MQADIANWAVSALAGRGSLAEEIQAPRNVCATSPQDDPVELLSIYYICNRIEVFGEAEVQPKRFLVHVLEEQARGPLPGGFGQNPRQISRSNCTTYKNKRRCGSKRSPDLVAARSF